MAERWNQERRNQEADELEEEAVKQARELLKETDEMSVKDRMTVLKGAELFVRYLRVGSKEQDDAETSEEIANLRKLRAADRARISRVRRGEAEESSGANG